MKKWILNILLCVSIFYNVTYVHAEDEMQLYAKAAVLMDADSGRILFAKNGQEMMPMASTTKIMTCILALEYASYDQKITFTKEAASQPKVHLGASVGETFLLRDLLYSLMLESHNDTAVAIAEGISGSVHDFTELMNAKASSIGCKHTHFVTPNGLDSSDLGGEHSITASDLALIMKYCIYDSDKREEFLQITRTKKYQFQNNDETKVYTCRNHNAFLEMMEGALSGKTGFTAKAGYCYVGALENQHRTFIVALLACGWPNHKGYKWSDTKKLMEFGINHYEYETLHVPKLEHKIVKDGIPINYEDSTIAYADFYYKKDLSARKILKNQTEEVTREIFMEKPVTAPKIKNEKVGYIQYKIDGKIIDQSDILMKNTIQKWNYAWTIRYICIKYIKILK